MPKVLLWNYEMCYFFIIGLSKVKRPSIPMSDLGQE